MKNIFHFHLIILLCALFVRYTSNGQESSIQENYYKEFDEIVGLENTSLSNGTRYVEKYRSRDGDYKFYFSSDYLNGNIQYDDQTFYGIEMKYDLYEDQIIVNIPFHSGTSEFQLIDKKVNGFFVNDTEFISIDNITNNEFGFYEVVFQSPHISLFKKYKKIRNEYVYEKSIFNKFKSTDYYLLYSSGNYNKIKSHKDIARLYPEHKSILNSYFKKQKSLRKSDYDLFMEKLMITLSDILIQNTIPH